MWLPLMLLALMASGSACPDLCECHQSYAEGDTPGLVDVTCRGRAPGLSEIPEETRKLSVSGAEEFEVTSFLEELDGDSVGEFEVNDAYGETNGTWKYLPYLDEVTVTNCSLVSLNVTCRGLQRVRALNLSCNSFTRLADVLVVHMTNLSELMCLDLSDNSLTDVSGGIFRTLAGLVHLNLSRNVIAAVHEEAFRGLDRLEFLDLSDNRLANLPDSALTPLYSLQKLDLSGNQLQVLGARWFESLDRLRELDVSRNGLARAASGTMQPLPGLSVLRLAENPLKERDVSLLLGTGRRLETVDASRTGLARVPAALTRSVRALRLAGNKLTTIRSGDLDSYPLLRMLDISDNRLTDIEEDALGRLEVLEELDISGNALMKIPRSLPSSLTVLKLQRNAITALNADDLQGLCNLRSLLLNDNDIREIEVGSLGQLSVLMELDLSDNPIKALPANTLSGPSNLARLRMSGLTSLQQEQNEQSDMAFPVPTPERLVVLDVSRSPVLAKQLLADDAALSACKSLLELNLSETNITGLRSDLLYMLPQLRTLDLSGNDWNCTEDLYWLGEWIRQHREMNRELQSSRCVSPQELVGSFLYELPSPPLPPTVPTTIMPITSSIVQMTGPTSLSFDPTIPSSSNADSIKDPEAETRGKKQSPAKIEREIGLGSTRMGTVFISPDAEFVPTTRNTERVYQAPTSFRNVTTPTEARRQDSKKTDGVSLERNSVEDVLVSSARKESGASITADDSNRGTFDNRVDGERQKSGRPNKLAVSGKVASSVPSKLHREKGEKKTTENYSRRLNNLTKEDLMPGSAPDSNTIAEEFNGRATDSGARVSEPLSAGTHPGMLVLAGAALGAAAALTVVLSRRATVRRRDRYHRHENIEVHTLTPTTELW